MIIDRRDVDRIRWGMLAPTVIGFAGLFIPALYWLGMVVWMSALVGSAIGRRLAPTDSVG